MIFKKNWLLFFLILISFIPLWDFFHAGIPQAHDIELHLARTASFYASLREGILIPRWSGNLNWGYGTPILMFVYPLPSYFSSLFLSLGFSLIDSVKILMISSFIFSGVFTYLWLKNLWGREAGFIGGLVYMFAPYRFVDLYVRGALGECVAFMFLPMVLYFSAKKNWLGISLSLAGLILSHNMLSLIFLPVIFFHMGYVIYISKEKKLVTCYLLAEKLCLLLATILGFALCAFFWLPAVFEAKYTLRDIVTKNSIAGFENLNRIFYSSWSYGGSGEFSVQIGLAQWALIIIVPLIIFIFWKKQQKIWVFLLGLLLFFFLSIFFMLPIAKDFYLQTPFLKNFQFAWRWLSLTIFPPAVFGAAFIYLLPKKYKVFCVLCLLLGVLWVNRDYWHAHSFLQKSESFYTKEFLGTTDTGEASPVWSIRFMEKKPKAHLEIISGQAEIKEISRTSTRHEYEVTVKEKTRLRENTLYFPGWGVLVDNQASTIEFQDPQNRGLMTFNLLPGNHHVLISFKETKLRFLADLISLVGLILLIFLFLLNWRKKLWKFQ